MAESGGKNAVSGEGLGRCLQQARLAGGLTQRQLASRCETSQPQLARFEGGKSVPSLAQLVRLGRELRVPLQYFLTGELQPGGEFQDLAVELVALGVEDLLLAGARLPGAFRPPEEV